MPQDYDRTPYEALLDIDYAITLHERHLRLYRHLRFVLTSVFALSGTAVFAGLLAEHAALARGTGLAIAVLAVLDQVLDPAQKIAAHAELKRRWCALLRDANALSLEAIDQRITELRSEDVHIIDALRLPTYNDNVRRHGRDDYVRPISLWAWTVSQLA